MPPKMRAAATVRLTEKQFQQQVIGTAGLYGWLVYHTFDSRKSVPGFPDLVAVHARQRRVIFAELKTETGTVSGAQQRWLDDLTAAGQEAAVWRPTDLDLIQAVFRGQRIGAA